jgi:methionine-rich copper-binding protein CopC
MSPEERDNFEEHYFYCNACGEDIRTGSVFVENAKSVFRDELRKAPASAKRSWLKGDWLRQLRLPIAAPAFAALALAAVVVYQNQVVIPALKAPESMGSPVILDGETRAQLPNKETGKPLRFQMMMLHAPEGDHVMVQVVNPAGKTVLTGSVEAPDVNQPLDVYFPGRLQPGRYALVVRSEQGENAGEELARNPFEIVAPIGIPTKIAVPAPRKIDGGRR